MGSFAAPVDTTGDPELEARWQALVQAVVDAKAAVDAARTEMGDAAVALTKARQATGGGGDAPLAVVNADVAARLAYRAAVDAATTAQARMKSGAL